MYYAYFIQHKKLHENRGLQFQVELGTKNNKN